MNCVVAIPARLDSSRLPRKLLADVGGKAMLQRVLERCLGARSPLAVVLCTDSRELQAAVASWGLAERVPVLLTGPHCTSGSDRLASVLPELLAFAAAAGGSQDPSSTWILNVQGDQPFVDPAVIDAMAHHCKELSSRADAGAPAVLTPVYRLAAATIHNPAVVKCLLAADGRCLTFSRSALPHVRDVPPDQWHAHASYWGHVGIYAYRADVLARWPDLPSSALEQAEKLEQLRLLEAGIAIGSFAVAGDSLSVDTAEQLAQAQRLAGS
jgi:3-deoxy-manno-octulosonate cytidylyltransferase (CMP-KDO synthetase)